MSEEEKSPETQGVSSAKLTSSAGSPGVSRDYDIIDEEAIRSSSPISYRSVAKTGQVIPITPEGEDNDQGLDDIAASTSDTSSRRLQGQGQTGSGEPTTSTQTPGLGTSSELNPFAKPFRKTDESGDTLLDAPPIPPHVDESSAQIGTDGARIDQESEHYQVEEQLRFPFTAKS